MRARRLFEALNRVASSAWVIFLVAFFLRIWVLAQVLPQQGLSGFYQFNEQARIAWAMVSGNGFSSPWVNTPLLPTAQQPPLYPWLLAAIFKLAGAYSYLSLWIADALNAAFAALTAVLILQLGKRSFGPAAGIVAAWVWAIWQYEAVVSIRVWESSLSALLLMFSIWWLPRLTKFSLPAWAGFGVLAGVCGLANTTLLAVFPFFWIWLWLRHRNQQGAAYLAYIAVSVFACVLTLAPWTARNYERFHRWIPVRDNFGFELWQGNHEGPKQDAGEYIRLGEIPFMEAKQHAAAEFIARNPGAFLLRCFQRAYHFWSDPDPVVWLPVTALSWMGVIFALWRRRRDAEPYAIVLFSFPLVYYITHPGATYRHPIEPVMVLLASYAVVTVGQWMGKMIAS
jgi:Dolichyl-phosphate-mannose-protein mannosyltransferase